MIKLIAFDFVGVLVREKESVLTDVQSNIERCFGPNVSDEQFFNDVKNRFGYDKTLIENEVPIIINSLYKKRDEYLIDKLKQVFWGKIIVATNHISYIDTFINNNFNVDDTIISANINKIKPNEDFYYEIIKKYNLLPNEILFLDDNRANIVGAQAIGINTILVDRNTDIYSEILKVLN